MIALEPNKNSISYAYHTRGASFKSSPLNDLISEAKDDLILIRVVDGTRMYGGEKKIVDNDKEISFTYTVAIQIDRQKMIQNYVLTIDL